MKRFLTLSILYLFCCCTAAKKPVPAETNRADHAPKPVAAVYRINAKVVPESLLVRADIDIDVQNINHDTFNLFWFAEAPEKNRHELGQTCKISRLAVNGNPVLAGRFSEDSSTALVKLTAPLIPGERIAVSLVLDARMTKADRWKYSDATGILFRNWVPRVVLGSDQVRYRRYFVDQPTDFEVTISIDSGWFVVAPGELLNDKSLLGAMPLSDTILTDVIHHPYEADGYTFSRLPSENGRDTYVYRKRYSRGYDFLVLNGYLLDRANHGDRKVEAYYPAELGKKWQGRLLRQSLSKSNFARYSEDLQPRDPLKLVVIGKKSYHYSSGVWLNKAD